jgi:hypothetical protein
MFYENYLEQEPELMFIDTDELEYSDEEEYRQDRVQEMANKFGGY